MIAVYLLTLLLGTLSGYGLVYVLSDFRKYRRIYRLLTSHSRL